MVGDDGAVDDAPDFTPIVREVLAFVETRQLVSTDEATTVLGSMQERASTAEGAIRTLSDAGVITAAQADGRIRELAYVSRVVAYVPGN